MAEVTSTLNLLSSDNPVFCCYCFWAGLLVLKMLLMTLLTAARRFSKKSFVNPEDLALSKAAEVSFQDPDVERVRRAHRNDLENILPYLLIALAYITTGPNAIVARLLFCIVAISRIFHTAIYAFRPVPQPSRSIAFFVPFFITLYMTFCVIVKMAKYV
ncbi:microsomal glutathione S-transferase 1 [Musca domestica]|uniref:Microsomal glutathione S-transferase 1 n=1 Tax=Musca domestica TaxID=7370 RepID=A0A1I8MJD3_MUSDO|nr:microsomal glutathione S-transferase 1 [Musca domestica]